ncbi:hypothetical protein ABEQ76_06800, partial [Bacillus velezensis]
RRKRKRGRRERRKGEEREEGRKRKEKLKARTFSYNEVKSQIRRQIAMDQLGDKATVKTLWKEAGVSWFYGEKRTK